MHSRPSDDNSSSRPLVDRPVRFEVTGRAAHSRLAPLVPSSWHDVSPYATTMGLQHESPHAAPDFLWENAPRHSTRDYRDHVRCYSHLPNGTAVLDDKWVLARLFARLPKDSAADPLLATLESHCFRGISGFQTFCDRTGMSKSDPSINEKIIGRLSDLLDEHEKVEFTTEPCNLWVVKDANSNGAGGIWIVDSRNAKQFADISTSPLLEEHRYVAQRYAWPPLLYGGRKFHVRVYGLLTCDGRAFVHKRAFLHVANEPFQYEQGKIPGSAASDGLFEPSRHITNCCVNSHDDSKFAGEICADFHLDSKEQVGASERHVVPLAKFFPSVAASVSTLAKASFPFLRGGEANNGMEYLGMDFILSYTEEGLPLAYLLEVNAPPSQDTATGLAHAEDLHDNIIRDILSLWVLPKVIGAAEEAGGFKCVYDEEQRSNESCDLQGKSGLVVPSKAAILNKIRWAIVERTASKEDTELQTAARQYVTSYGKDSLFHRTGSMHPVTHFARKQFLFFGEAVVSTAGENSSSTLSGAQIFFENGGGAQVPVQVINAMQASLCARDRCTYGAKYKESARETLRTILGGSADEHDVFLGANATSLLGTLAQDYIDSGLLISDDEIVISTENHLANVTPWLQAARTVGASVKWWDINTTLQLEDLVTPRTRIVAVSHASNILGQIRDIRSICCLAKEKSSGYARIVVDGVAVVPHASASMVKTRADWYVISCHKLFGPHLGALCGTQMAIRELQRSARKDQWTNLFEHGTVNYDACAGVGGLAKYFRQLANFSRTLNMEGPCSESLTSDLVDKAYRRICLAETPLIEQLYTGLSSYSKVRIIESDAHSCTARLPLVSFVHCHIASMDIVKYCRARGISCRASTFLSTERLQHTLRFGTPSDDDPVRISLAHYNTEGELQRLFKTLESIPEWK